MPQDLAFSYILSQELSSHELFPSSKRFSSRNLKRTVSKHRKFILRSPYHNEIAYDGLR
ncbi:uncharacterized protein G2W53_017576 [Senna tora]|uniref:Uncharacterized protein n=1 Tax=Senna tora TaxID=362788 RepID=A0A834TR40_9FABA|nr:uncharacterized protein G2W53_017576 [Senna tora]